MDIVLMILAIVAIGAIVATLSMMLAIFILRLNDYHIDFDLNDDEDLP